jgi:hypothetical protein
MTGQRPKQLFKRGYDGDDGPFVRGGWALTGTVLTDGVSLCAPRWCMPKAVVEAAVVAAMGKGGSRAQLDPVLDVTRHLRPVNNSVDPGVVKSVVAAVPLVRNGVVGEVPHCKLIAGKH